MDAIIILPLCGTELLPSHPHKGTLSTWKIAFLSEKAILTFVTNNTSETATERDKGRGGNVFNAIQFLYFVCFTALCVMPVSLLRWCPVVFPVPRWLPLYMAVGRISCTLCPRPYTYSNNKAEAEKGASRWECAQRGSGVGGEVRSSMCLLSCFKRSL